MLRVLVQPMHVDHCLLPVANYHLIALIFIR
jgi:hypothetical protein